MLPNTSLKLFTIKKIKKITKKKNDLGPQEYRLRTAKITNKNTPSLQEYKL